MAQFTANAGKPRRKIVLKYFVSWPVNPVLKQYPVFRILYHCPAGTKPPQIMPWITTISAKCAADNNTPPLYKGRNTHLHSKNRESIGTIKFPAGKPQKTETHICVAKPGKPPEL